MPMNVKPVPDARRADQRHPHAHGRDRQRRDPAQREQALAGSRATAPTRPSARSRAELRAARQGAGEAGRAVGAAPAPGVRRHGPRLPGPRLHERGAGLRRRRRRRCSASWRPTRATRRSSSSTAPRSRSRSGCCPLIDGTMESGLLDDRAREPRLRPPLAHDERRARRRRVGHQRPQVVHVERLRRRLLHRHVPRRRTTPASSGPARWRRSSCRPTRQGLTIVRGVGVWGSETSDHCEVALRGRARAGREHPRARRRGPPGRPGPPRRRAHLPLHELGRADVAGVRPDGRAGRSRARSTAGCRRTSSSSRASSPTATWTSRRPA